LIDYLGRKTPTVGIGVCYDDVAYATVANFAAAAPPPPGANALNLFSDNSRSLEERLSAARELKVTNPDDARNLLKFAGNKEAPARLRIRALSVGASLDDDQVVQDVMALARDKDNPPELRRRAAFRLSFQLNFSAAAHTRQAAYMDTLRALLDDPDQAVRDTAVSTLVAHGDTTVLRRLAEGLSDPAKEIQPADRALHSLATAPHADYYDVFKSYYEHAHDVATRIEAARGLARFPAGHEQLRKALADPKEDPRLRLAILQALNANATAEFLPAALAVAEDSKNSPALRALGLGAVTQQVERMRKAAGVAPPDIAQITSRMRAFASQAPTAELRAQAWHFLRRNDPHFVDDAPALLNSEKDEQLKLRVQKMLIDEQKQVIQKLRSGKQ
jgi:hypothetical protein